MTIIEDRLEAIRLQLVAGHAAGAGLSSATKGNEREQLVGGFLEQVFPPMYRFGTGDVVDPDGRRTGQLDIVVEYPFTPSFPALGGGPRVYPAEGIAAVIEVKSDVANQRDEIVATATRVKALRPRRHDAFVMGESPKSVAFYAIGFRGWQTPQGALGLIASGVVDAVYEIESGRCTVAAGFAGAKAAGWIQGPSAMVALVDGIRADLTKLLMAGASLAWYSSVRGG